MKVGGKGHLRCRHKIISDLMKLLMENGEIPRTHVMYKGNLSYTQMTEYLAVLVAAGLVQETADSGRNGKTARCCYRITGKGREFADVYERLEGLLLMAAEQTVTTEQH